MSTTVHALTTSGKICCGGGWCGWSRVTKTEIRLYYRDYDSSDDECKKSDRMGLETILTKFGSFVENCCEIDGYVDEDGRCDGQDKQVNSS